MLYGLCHDSQIFSRQQNAKSMPEVFESSINVVISSMLFVLIYFSLKVNVYHVKDFAETVLYSTKIRIFEIIQYGLKDCQMLDSSGIRNRIRKLKAVLKLGLWLAHFDIYIINLIRLYGYTCRDIRLLMHYTFLHY